MSNLKKLSLRYKQEIRKRRQKDVQKQRLCHNIRRHPWSLASVALFLLMLVWFMLKVSIPLPGGGDNPLLIIIWNSATKSAISLLAILLIFATLTAAPREAKEWELTLRHIGIVDNCKFGPILIAKQRLANSGNQRYIFYSRGISEKLWEEKKQEIQKDMAVVLEREENPKYTHEYCISFIVNPDFENQRRKQLTDDEL